MTVAFAVVFAGVPAIAAALPFLQTAVFDPLKPIVYMRRPVCGLNVDQNSLAGQLPPVPTAKSAYPPALIGTGALIFPYSFPLNESSHSFVAVLEVE
jgi:hypothetical protein